MILAAVSRMASEEVPIGDALGRVLAEDVVSPLALPPWDNASMDGYAVRAADVTGATRDAPVRLQVAATVAAGGAATMRVDTGTAVRIMTGAPVPAGADSVVRVEDTDGGEHAVTVYSDRDALRNVRPRGEDIGADEVAVAAGEALGPGHIGFLASIGRARVRVYGRPRVAILASGDELVDVDRFDEVRAGRRIVSSNSHSLAAAVRGAGADPLSLGFVGDDFNAIRDRLASCECDLLLTTGGVSVGAFDHTRAVISSLGGDDAHRFWRVKIRPGAPLGFGIVRGTPWIGLPGNPVSALVTFELFARPAIRKMLGHSLPFRRVVAVRLEEEVTIAAPLTHFLRAVVRVTGGGMTARLTGPQGSGLLSSMARANALLVVPPDRPRIAAGELAQAMLLREDTGHSSAPPGD